MSQKESLQNLDAHLCQALYHIAICGLLSDQEKINLKTSVVKAQREVMTKLQTIQLDSQS